MGERCLTCVNCLRFLRRPQSSRLWRRVSPARCPAPSRRRPTNPTSADQIQNIDQVKTAIKALLRRHAHQPGRSGAERDRQLDREAAPVLADRRLRRRDGAGIAVRRREVPGKQAHPASGNGKNVLRHAGDPVRHRRHDAEHLQLRDLQQLRVQPDDERGVRQRTARPGVFPAVPGMVDLEHEGRVARATRCSSSPGGRRTRRPTRRPARSPT